MFDKAAAKTTLSQRLTVSSSERVDVIIERLNASRDASDAVRKSNLLELILSLKSDDQIVDFLDTRQNLIKGLNKSFDAQAQNVQQANDIKVQIAEGFNDSIEYLKANLRTTIEHEIKQNLVDSFERIINKTKKDFDL